MSPSELWTCSRCAIPFALAVSLSLCVQFNASPSHTTQIRIYTCGRCTTRTQEKTRRKMECGEQTETRLNEQTKVQQQRALSATAPVFAETPPDSPIQLPSAQTSSHGAHSHTQKARARDKRRWKRLTHVPFFKIHAVPPSHFQ